jgi:hypothetical protein
LVLALTLRGAPHLHRRADLDALRAGLMPEDTAELATWLGGYGATLAAADVDGPALVHLVAELLRSALPSGTATKGELSGRVSPDLPDIARPWCEGCQVHHITEGLFRLGTLIAGLELEEGGRGLVFRPGPTGPTGPADTADTADPVDPAPGVDRPDLARGFLRMVGPARPADLTTWLSTLPHPAGAALSGKLWRALGDELVPVDVDGRRRWIPAGQASAVAAAEPARMVRLLPSRDPYLLGERDLVVPDGTAARQVWRAIGAPGVLLVDGEVLGTWRQRLSGRRLDLDVRLFGRLAAARRTELNRQAERVAAVRAAPDVRIHLDG